MKHKKLYGALIGIVLSAGCSSNREVPILVEECLNKINKHEYHTDVERAVEQVAYAALNKYGEEVGIGAIADVNPQLAGLINRSRDIFENTGVSGYGEIARHYSDPSINHFPIDVDIPATCYDPLLGYITDKK